MEREFSFCVSGDRRRKESRTEEGATDTAVCCLLSAAAGCYLPAEEKLQIPHCRCSCSIGLRFNFCLSLVVIAACRRAAACSSQAGAGGSRQDVKRRRM